MAEDSTHVTTVEALYWNSKLSFGERNNSLLLPLSIGSSERCGSALLLDLVFVEGVNLNLQELDIVFTLKSKGITHNIHLDCEQAICLADSESRNYSLYAIPLDTEQRFDDAQDVRRYLKNVYKWIAEPRGRESIPANVLTDIFMSYTSSIKCQCFCWGFDGSPIATHHILGLAWKWNDSALVEPPNRFECSNFKWND